ncbi:sensor histidine kinase [Breznakia pachnodae]|uniref:histidine kinase n=1 Tax=Breznakia pachnodae TaxID=265178 RepID=A0ABU0DY92_9FIRM|nr:HAMP domain-containing sensor histidine kinase [Breznakia pachnodae]MDQ0359520.1 signal transduction histidine kinase [Breznakia pachnodae]
MNKKIVKISSVLILVVLSVFMMFQYDGVKEDIEQQNKKELIRDLVSEAPGLEYALLSTTTDKSDFYEKYFEFDDELKKDKDEFSWTKNNIMDMLTERINTIDNSDQLYYSIEIDGDPIIYTNTAENIADLRNNQNRRKDYHGYLVVHFDENGTVSVEGSIDGYDHQKEYLAKEIGSVESLSNVAKYTKEGSYYEDYYNGYNSIMSAKPIKNTTITYAIPKYNISTSEYYGWGTDTLTWDYMGALLPYFLMAAAALALYIFACPLKILEECHIYRVVKKVKLEILIVCLGVMGGILLYATPLIAGISNHQIAIAGFQHLIDNEVLVIAINGLMWCLVFQYVAVIIFMFKYIILNGFSYFKYNTCVLWVVRKIKHFISKLVSFDIQKDINKKLLLFVFINFVCIFMCVISPGFGFLLAAVYTVLLFITIKRKIDEERANYHRLLDATKKLSSGNFDVELNGNLGQFQSLGNEFVRIKDGFQTAVGEEVKSQRMKTELISNVSHDLKTPLTTIITYIDLLKAEKLNEQEKEYVNTLDSSALRLKRLIDDLFEVSKANSGNIQLNIEEVDIVALLNQVHFENLNCIDNKHLDFKIHTSSDHIMLNLDSIKTYRVFDNLIMNIYKYALSNTRVYIDISELENEVLVSFKNISEQEIKMDIDLLSERFVQGDESRNQEGAGLGLAIVKSFTNVQGGEMNLYVDGDLFKVELIFPKEKVSSWQKSEDSLQNSQKDS